jgi:hypothetical protein
VLPDTTKRWNASMTSGASPRWRSHEPGFRDGLLEGVEVGEHGPRRGCGLRRPANVDHLVADADQPRNQKGADVSGKQIWQNCGWL